MTHLTPLQSQRLMTVPDAPDTVVAIDSSDTKLLRALVAKGLAESRWSGVTMRWVFHRTPFGTETAKRLAVRHPC